MKSEFIRVASVEDVPLGSMRRFEIGPDKIVVAHTSDGMFALADECSHAAVSLSNGRLDGCEIECTAHGARFDVRTGEVKAPPAVAPIDTLELEVREHDIYVRLDR